MSKKTTKITTEALPTQPQSQHALSVYIFCGSLTLISSLGFWLGLNASLKYPYVAIQGSSNFYWNDIGLMAISYLTIFTMIVFISGLVKNPLVRRSLLAIIPLTISIFAMRFIFTLGLTFLLLLVILAVDYFSHKDISNQVIPNLRQIYMTRLSWISTVFALIIAILVYYSGPSNLDKIHLSVPSSFFDQAANVSRPLLEEQIKQQQNKLIDKIILQLETQFPGLKEVNYQDKVELLSGTITPEVRKALSSQGFSDNQIEQIATQLKENMPQETSQPQVNIINETIDQAKKDLQSIVNNFIDQNINMVPGILSATIFLFFNFIGILFNLVAVGLAIIFIRILKRFGWIRIETKQIDAQTYTIA
ncbi:hypothetical protein HGA91_00725 [candidate division WWE3 bacterium]|nr:hypothetical protein [candidate division WWE3 bacterium]